MLLYLNNFFFYTDRVVPVLSLVHTFPSPSLPCSPQQQKQVHPQQKIQLSFDIISIKFKI